MTKRPAKIDQKQLREAQRYFLWPIDIGQTKNEITKLVESVDKSIAAPAKIFLENLEAAIAAASIPMTLASASVHLSRLHQLTTVERIRMLKKDLSDGRMEQEKFENPEVEAHARALKSFDFELAGNGASALANQTIAFLSSSLHNQESKLASQELLRQTAVMVWGAFEVLCRDIFVNYLNANPNEAEKLVSDPNTRKIYQTKSIDLDVLSVYSFNISKNLGDVFANVYDLSSLGVIKQTFNVLFASEKDLRDQLQNKNLWMLHQRRHLIVHRRGIVDKQFLEKTGEKIKIGKQLTPTPDEIEEYIKLVCSAGIALVKAVAKK